MRCRDYRFIIISAIIYCNNYINLLKALKFSFVKIAIVN